MDKRTLLAVAISMGVILIWWKIFPPNPPTPVPAQPTTSVAAAPGSAPTGAPAVGAPDPSGSTQAAQAAAAALPPEQIVTLVAPHARYDLSNRGGVLRRARITEERFLAKKGDPDSGLDMLGVARPDLGSLTLAAPQAGYLIPEGNWTVSRPAPDAVTFRGENDKVAVEKRFKIEGDFRLNLEIVVENKTQTALDSSLAVRLFARQDPAASSGGFFAGPGDLSSLVCHIAGEVERSTVADLQQEPREFTGAVTWAAADTKYFALAVVPHPVGQADRRCGTRAIDGEHAETFLSFGKRSLAPNGKDSYALTIYAGPKYTETLEQVRPGGADAELAEVVDVMFAVLSRPLLYMMKLFHGWVGNWGLAIIMLTFFVKLLTIYPTHRAMMSGKKMQRLAPKMQELKKKYENDRQRMGIETMNLYKQEGVSPLGGCLPSLITMPIWMALFSTLNYAVELYKTPFFGYIQDLSARDPYFITPLIMGGIMFLQMKMAPAGADPMQQKMMTYMMPVMFTAFSLFLAAGLAIYTLTNSLLSILQQVVVNRMDKKLAASGK